VASTIVDVTGPRPQILRLGAIDADDLREVVPDVVAGAASG
jgi:tRNA A37 threonylcarbamoyladenosine synthetase subunit TsaC/SUA5/YrdC